MICLALSYPPFLGPQSAVVQTKQEVQTKQLPWRMSPLGERWGEATGRVEALLGEASLHRPSRAGSGSLEPPDTGFARSSAERDRPWQVPGQSLERCTEVTGNWNWELLSG